MPYPRKRRSSLKLDRLTEEQQREIESLYAKGVSYEEMAQHITKSLGLPVSHNAVTSYCRKRIDRAAERAARLQEQAETIARALLATNSSEANTKTRAALHAVFFNLLNDAPDQDLTEVARELRELEKVDVARERVAIEQQKVKISEKQLALKNKELEARLAAARAAVQQIEEAAANGNAALPANLLEKLKEAYGIA